jgi:hypothetical protein
MVFNFKELRPQANYPPYPPYHTGPYLEEYFYNFYLKNKEQFDLTGYTLIPIFWTNLLHSRTHTKENIQQFINVLPKDKKYFTVSQLDDGIEQKLPLNTINFVAGGNMEGICLPLICSSIPSQYIEKRNKDIFCSFVGTYVTNDEKYKCRLTTFQTYQNDTDFYFSVPRHWQHIVNEQNFLEFINVTQRSKFTLCPRGYGLSSFRLYETMQLNSVPVYIFNKRFTPFEDILDWKEFCILIHESEISQLKEKLLSISENKYNEMLKRGQEVYKNYFTLEKTSQQILRILKNECFN